MASKRRLTGRTILPLTGGFLLASSPPPVPPRTATPAAPVAEPAYQSSPERRVVAERDWGPWLGPFRARLVPSLMRDFGERYLYAAADRALPPPAPGERRVVFLGDSITDRWDLARSFPGRPYVNRGIGSQVTAQLILRFHQDVVALRPAAVVVLAGVNDVQGFLQAETPAQIEANWEAIADLADAHGIRVVFGSLLPVNDYTPQAAHVLEERDPAELRALNAWLRAFCGRRGYVYADYYSVLADGRGLMRRDLTVDGVHPLRAGYDRMAPVAQAAIDRALAPCWRRSRYAPMRRTFKCGHGHGRGPAASTGEETGP